MGWICLSSKVMLVYGSAYGSGDGWMDLFCGVPILRTGAFNHSQFRSTVLVLLIEDKEIATFVSILTL